MHAGGKGKEGKGQSHEGGYRPCQACGYKLTFATKPYCHSCGLKLGRASQPHRQPPGSAWSQTAQRQRAEHAAKAKREREVKAEAAKRQREAAEGEAAKQPTQVESLTEMLEDCRSCEMEDAFLEDLLKAGLEAARKERN